MPLAPTAAVEAALGLDALRAALAALTLSPLGCARAQSLPYLPDAAAMAAAHAEVQEARALLRVPGAGAAVGFDDAGATLERIVREADVDGRELRALGEVLRAIGQVRRFYALQRAQAPGLAQRAGTLPDVAEPQGAIQEAIAADGTVRDDASLELLQARGNVRRLRQRIQAQMEGYLTDPVLSGYLQDSYISVRHGRFVLPVNASFQAKVPGIVHNASQTGQTLFIEPEAITTLGNELAVAESRAEEAERQVLRLLADLVRPQAEDVAAAQQVLAHLDVVLASAALAEQLQLQPPRLVASDAPLHLPQLRHAALALAGAQVVPNDVGLAGAEQVLLLSGPNAGGKTVLMAAVGAATLMAQLGLPIASGPGARLPVFCGLYCAIGDAQSLQQGLSSFAAQLLGLQALMGEVAPGQLVLIDELGGDTDPTEGGALARAVLERVADAGARGIVTTHLEALKAIAHVDGRFVNAGVGYDRQTLRPTYRLERGAPGRSFALEAAERMGFDAAVLARAREHLAATDPLAEARAQLAVGERALAAAQAELAGERAALEAAAGAQRAELQRREAELAAAEQRQAAVHAQALAASATEARAQLARVRAAETVREAERVAQAMASQAAAAKRAAQGPPPVRGPRLDAATARPDQRVRVHPLGQQGRIVRVEGAQAEVAVGAMRLRARLADLELVRGRDAQLVTPAGPPRSSRPGDPPPSPAVAAAEAGRADVRGLRADEAERALGAALDACLSVGTRVLVVVHGHGTGALRELVRELLQTSPYVTEHRPGERHEGGDGVTVVTLDA